MAAILPYDILFYVFWLLVNSIVYFAEIDFLIRFTKSSGRQYAPLYIAINAVITIFAISLEMFLLSNLLQLMVFFLFSAVVLRIPLKIAVAPAMILFTLTTFMNGFASIFLRFFSMTLKSPFWGLVLQLVFPLLLAILLIPILRLLLIKYPFTREDIAFNYLYILLLPCTLLIFAIETSLGLNQETGALSHGAIVGGNVNALLLALFLMLTALIIFFVIIEVFHKITVLSQQKTEQALLAEQIRKQGSYIAEAQQRNQSYRSFQHDINNHLLVLSGLLNANNYTEARNYVQKLYGTARNLSMEVFTGNIALDVLLWEKIGYAKQKGIAVTVDIQTSNLICLDDIDLCILFSNALDNAIAACSKVQSEHKTITLAAKQKHTFLLIDIVNTINTSYAPLHYGTGLKNIKLTAEKSETCT